MATKRAKKTPEALPPRDATVFAQMCGMAAGLPDQLERLQDAVESILMRCNGIEIINEKLGLLKDKDLRMVAKMKVMIQALDINSSARTLADEISTAVNDKHL